MNPNDAPVPPEGYEIATPELTSIPSVLDGWMYRLIYWDDWRWLPTSEYPNWTSRDLTNESIFARPIPPQPETGGEPVRFMTECSVCRIQRPNWVGSTPCCGGIAYVISETKSPADASETATPSEFPKPGSVLWDEFVEREYDRDEDLEPMLAHAVNTLHETQRELKQAQQERDTAVEKQEGLTKYHDRVQEVMPKIAEIFGILTPLQLIAVAENNEEDYFDLLIKVGRKEMNDERKRCQQMIEGKVADDKLHKLTIERISAEQVAERKVLLQERDTLKAALDEAKLVTCDIKEMTRDELEEELSLKRYLCSNHRTITDGLRIKTYSEIANIQCLNGGASPDAIQVAMKTGEIVIIGEEGINVYRNSSECAAMGEPAKCIEFLTL